MVMYRQRMDFGLALELFFHPHFLLQHQAIHYLLHHRHLFLHHTHHPLISHHRLTVHHTIASHHALCSHHILVAHHALAPHPHHVLATQP